MLIGFLCSCELKNQTGCQHLILYIGMTSNMSRKIRAIKVPDRTRVDSTRPNMIMDTIRNRVMNATVDLLRGLSKVSDPSTYPNVARGLMMMANSTPIRCMCVGISPYENGILPGFATALAYNPLLCDGVTPSIQVMSQIMSRCAVSIKGKFMIDHPDLDPNTFMTRHQYTARFAFMLRCSYVCVEAGVCFINASPVITKTTSAECMSVSLFSEWIARVVMIHNAFGYKIRVTSMGGLADEAIGDAMSAYPGMSSSMNLVRCVNPAMISRMNVKKTPAMCPIPDLPSNAETYLESITDGVVYSSPCVRFGWNEYPDEIMLEYIGEDAVRPAVELLVDHAPDQLLNKYINSVRNLHRIMSDFDLESMMAGVGVSESVDGGGNMDGDARETEYHPETTSTQPDTSKKMFANPFNPTNMGTGGDQGANTYGAGYGGGSGSGSGRGAPGGFDGPVGALKRSQLGQLLDPTGKGVSQQVIVISSINQRANEILLAYKSSCNDVIQLIQRQAMLMEHMGPTGVIDESMHTDVTELCDMFMQVCDTTMTRMQEACGFIEGLPAVVEGDTGIYVKETMPVAPLLRRDDGSTMKQNVYGPAEKMARMNASVNRDVDTNTDTKPSMEMPFRTVENTGPNVSMISSTNLVEGGDKTYYETATQTLIGEMRSTKFGDGITPKQVYENLRSYTVKHGTLNTDMFSVMCTIVSERMSIDGGGSMPEDELECIIGMLDTGSNEDIAQCVEVFGDAVRNRTTLTAFFSEMRENMDS